MCVAWTFVIYVQGNNRFLPCFTLPEPYSIDGVQKENTIRTYFFPSQFGGLNQSLNQFRGICARWTAPLMMPEKNCTQGLSDKSRQPLFTEILPTTSVALARARCTSVLRPGKWSRRCLFDYIFSSFNSLQDSSKPFDPSLSKLSALYRWSHGCEGKVTSSYLNTVPFQQFWHFDGYFDVMGLKLLGVSTPNNF